MRTELHTLRVKQAVKLHLLSYDYISHRLPNDEISLGYLGNETMFSQQFGIVTTLVITV